MYQVMVTTNVLVRKTSTPISRSPENYVGDQTFNIAKVNLPKSFWKCDDYIHTI